MLVLKKDEKVKMYVDHRDLNLDNPKDDFPLLHTNIVMNNTAKNSMLSIMDSFSEYNQIKMASEDKEKTTFITFEGIFCYKVMPFRLKNVGAMY